MAQQQGPGLSQQQVATLQLLQLTYQLVKEGLTDSEIRFRLAQQGVIDPDHATRLIAQARKTYTTGQRMTALRDVAIGVVIAVIGIVVSGGAFVPGEDVDTLMVIITWAALLIGLVFAARGGLRIVRAGR